MNILGFVIFPGMLGLPAPMWLMTETYMAGVREAMGEKYVMEVTKIYAAMDGICGSGLYYYFFNSWGIIGRRMLKKHFEGNCIVWKKI